MFRIKNFLLAALAITVIACSTHTDEPPEPEPFIVPSPTEYHFGVGGGSVTIELEARFEIVYGEWRMDFAGHTTNQYGVVMNKHLNPSAPDWELLEHDVMDTPPFLVTGIRSEWFELNRIETGRQVVVKVDPNTSGNERRVILAIEAPGSETILVPITQSAE